MDSGATSHMASDDGILSTSHTSHPFRVIVGDGSSMPISRSDNTLLSTPSCSPFLLNNVLIVPSLVRNLLSVRKFTRGNSCSIEFYSSGFSVKDL